MGEQGRNWKGLFKWPDTAGLVDMAQHRPDGAHTWSTSKRNLLVSVPTHRAEFYFWKDYAGSAVPQYWLSVPCSMKWNSCMDPTDTVPLQVHVDCGPSFTCRLRKSWRNGP